MSTSPAPLPEPQPTRVAPGPVPAPLPAPPTRRRTRLPIFLAVLGLIGLASFWLFRASQTDTTGGGGPIAAVRTANVSSEDFERTVRLTGSTGAERFVSLITPQMRGSRSGFGRDGGSSGGGGSRGGASGGGSRGAGIASSGSTGSSGGGSSSSSSSGGSSSGSSSVGASGLSSGSGSTPGSSSVGSAGSGGNMGAGGAGGGFRGASNRFGGSSRLSGAQSSTGSQTAAASAISGDLGSTSGSLQGGGSGGGGGGTPVVGAGFGGAGGDFMMVLQELVKPGSFVKKGQVVAEFDRQYMMNRLDDYRASVVQVEAAFRKLQAELEVTRKAHDQQIEVAKAELEKAKLDLKTSPVRGTIDQEQLQLAVEEAEARLKQLLAEVKHQRTVEQAQLKVQEIELQQSQIELRRAEANADRMMVKAPIEGLTVMQNLVRGTEMSQIQQGDQLFPGMQFMQIVDPSSMIVNAGVNQVDVEQLRVGAKAKVRFDAYPGLELPARVISVGAMPKAGGQRATFVKEIPVRLKLEAMDPRVIPDLSVSVDVIAETHPKTTVAPLAAIFEDGNGERFVWVQGPGGWEKRKIETGPANYLQAVIRSGVRPGEVVAAEWPHQDENQQRVVPENIKLASRF